MVTQLSKLKRDLKTLKKKGETASKRCVPQYTKKGLKKTRKLNNRCSSTEEWKGQMKREETEQETLLMKLNQDIEEIKQKIKKLEDKK